MPRRDLYGRTALITGGGSGIGRGIALALARRGAPVALCGRRAEPLQAVAAEIRALGVQAAVVPGDITIGASRAAVLAAARDALGPLHILVHNAGLLAGGALFQLNAAEIEGAVATNLLAPIDLTRLALPDLMLTRGAVVCVGSTMSRVPLPHAALYSATKSGLHGFCAALRYELAPCGVHLLEAYPPGVATDMTAAMARRTADGLPGWLPRSLRARLARGEAPAAAGERIVAALAAGEEEVAWGMGERWLVRLHAAAPGLAGKLLAASRRQFAHALTPEPHAGDLQAQLAAVRAAYPLQAATIGGHTWTYLDTAQGGEVLLLLPGAMGTADTSFQYIRAFAPRYRVVSLDYPPTIDQLPSLLDGLERLLASLNVGRAHVVGGSYSGLVAQYLASARPHAVAALLLSNTPPPDAAQAGRWRSWAAAAAPLPQGLVHGIMRRLIRRFLPGDSPAEQFWRAYFAAAIPHLRKQSMLARLRLTGAMHESSTRLWAAPYRGPVLIVEAAHDAMVSPEEQSALRALYPQAERIVLPQRGHTASLDDADSYISIYRNFLCRHSMQPGR